MMRILALDPGYTTGWAMFKKPNNRDGYTSGQVGASAVWGLLESSKFRPDTDPFYYESRPDDGLVIVYEKFQFRQIPKADLSPVEVIGVVKEWARQNSVALEPQTPSQAVGPKAFFNNDRLDRMGLLKKPQYPNRHANDAMRHLLYYLGFGKGVTLGEGVITK